jgi:hypothetical protein
MKNIFELNLANTSVTIESIGLGSTILQQSYVSHYGNYYAKWKD